MCRHVIIHGNIVASWRSVQQSSERLTSLDVWGRNVEVGVLKCCQLEKQHAEGPHIGCCTDGLEFMHSAAHHLRRHESCRAPGSQAQSCSENDLTIADQAVNKGVSEY